MGRGGGARREGAGCHRRPYVRMLQSGSFLDGQEDAKTRAEALECTNLFPVAGVRPVRQEALR